ncbi:MAG: DUF3108 domain-containing protein [Calditerrivibrio sp.]|uniref:DUF3108 domain-containing protein n=1 Tax=Calditerrivibrio sp. TaxID=2792612 RepID=UPI003D11DAB0
MRKLLLLFFIFILPIAVFADDLSLCYNVKALFVTVGKTCIHYKKDKDTLYFNSIIRSSRLVSFMKRIEDKGKGIADLKSFKPKYFLFDQEESKYKATNEYIYHDDKIVSKTTHYDKSWKPTEEEIKEFNSTDYFEPFMLSMVFYKNIHHKKEEPLKLFYKNKTYNIPYKILGDEIEEINGKKVPVKKISVKPFIKGKGLLVPYGEWFIYLDKSNLYPVKIEAKFVFVSAVAYIETIEGKNTLIKEIIEQYSN